MKEYEQHMATEHHMQREKVSAIFSEQGEKEDKHEELETSYRTYLVIVRKPKYTVTSKPSRSQLSSQPRRASQYEIIPPKKLRQNLFGPMKEYDIETAYVDWSTSGFLEDSQQPLIYALWSL